MGRDAGWLAASTILARNQPDDPPDGIYTPEASDRFSLDCMMAIIQRGLTKRGYSIITVSEGLRLGGGDQRKLIDLGILTEKELEEALKKKDDFGHVRLGGLGERLAAYAEHVAGEKAYAEKISLEKVESREDKMGYLQRTFMPCMSEFDREDSYVAGQVAVYYAMEEGRNGHMVGFKPRLGNITLRDVMSIPLEDVAANSPKPLPAEFITSAGNDINPSFRDYVRPLVGQRLPYCRLLGIKFELPEKGK